MMDFISIPMTTGIVFAAIYGLFELIIRRKERLAIIEKIGEKIGADSFDGRLSLPSYGTPRFSFSALKAGCLLAGIGLGLLVGFFIVWIFMHDATFYNDKANTYDLMGVVYGSSVLLFGGIGLLLAFVIEMKMSKDKKE